VAAFTTTAHYDVGTLLKALNATLPEDIRVRAVQEVDPRFDPRRHASSRVYRYLLLNQPVASALWRRFTHHVPARLDLQGMQQAAQALVGLHDFRSFCGRVAWRGESTVRRVLRSQVEQRGPLVSLEMEANAFLPHQVRRTAGALVRLGRGKMGLEEFKALVESPGSAVAGPALPARGLCLVRVLYRDGLQIERPAVAGDMPVACTNTPSSGAVGDDWTPWLP
jgi:tRNA pseudouridine38-40 synthase